MKLLGIDYGKARIGLATGDTEVSLSFPLRSVDATGDAIIEILTIAKEEGIEKIVVGVPYRIDAASEAGEIENAVYVFINEMKQETEIPIDTEDERFSTAAADALRKEAGISGKKFDKDAAAAAAILETYMTRTKD